MQVLTATRRSPGARPQDDDLLDAVRGVFAAAGPNGATMNALAAAAGTTKPTLYAHFGDKDTLYRLVLEREAATCRDWLADAYRRNAGLGLVEQAEADTIAFFDYAAAHPEGFALLIAGAPAQRSTEIEQALLAAVSDQVARRIRDFLGADADEFVVGQLAASLVGVSVASAQEAVRTGRDLAAAGQFAARFNSAALAGLAAALR